MNFIGTHLSYAANGKSIGLNRNVDNHTAFIDNLIELIVFTPPGGFKADPDFGFEYWNYEYSNMRQRNMHNLTPPLIDFGMFNDISRMECRERLIKSLATYEPMLKQVEVDIEINPIDADKSRMKKISSKYEVTVNVAGALDDGLGTIVPYEKKVSFYMEPTAKQKSI